MENPDGKKITACCDTLPSRKIDYLLWSVLTIASAAYGMHIFFPDNVMFLPALHHFTGAIFTLLNTIWWGVLLGILAVGLLGKIPRELVVALLGQGGLHGILRATLAGVLLDLCSHGILLVGAKLYERGVSIGQVMAFLIASPWNSLSLTLILIALIGLSWTLLFVAISMVIAVITGVIFMLLDEHGWIVANPHGLELPEDFRLIPQARVRLQTFRPSTEWFGTILREGVQGSRIAIRWILFGIIITAMVQAFVATDHLQTYFGATIVGLLLTLGVATVTEVCSEGMVPLASDLFHRARAPGNGFLFLMAGVSTDYTEILVLKNTTRSLAIALLLPAITLPQVIMTAWLMNQSPL